MTALTAPEMTTAIEATIEANAAAFGEAPTVGLRVMRDGSVRIQTRRNGKWVRGQHKTYTSLTRCYEASQVAARRAALVEKFVVAGMPVDMAVTEAIKAEP